MPAWLNATQPTEVLRIIVAKTAALRPNEDARAK